MANKNIVLCNPEDSTEEWYPTTLDSNVHDENGKSVPDKYISYETQNGNPSQTLNVLLNTIFPVGSVRISFNAGETNFMGGTWELVQGKFLLGASAEYPASSTGGEATHELTNAEMPSHNHLQHWAGTDGGTIYIYALTYGSGSSWGMNVNRVNQPTAANTATSNYLGTGASGGGQAHNNMPPYIAVYIYRRVA